MAPVVGRLLARSIATGVEAPEMVPWKVSRFKEGSTLSEGMILG